MVQCSACKLTGHKSNSRLCALFQPKQITCSSCKQPGHKSNNKSCPLFEPKLITCSTCKQTGHKSNSRLCGGNPYQLVEDIPIMNTLDIEHENRCQLITTSCLTQMEIIKRWVSVDYFLANYVSYRLNTRTVNLHDDLCIIYTDLLNTKNIIKDKSTPTMENFKNIIHMEHLIVNNYNSIIRSVNSFNNYKYFSIFIIFNRHDNPCTTNINVDLWNFKFKRVIEVKTLSCIQSNFNDTDTHFDCGICFENKSNDKLCLFNQCFQNKHQFCIDCVNTFIHTCKNNNQNVSCPLCRNTIHQVFTNSKDIQSTVVKKF